MNNVIILTSILIFLGSFLVSLIPKFIVKMASIKRVYPFITVFTAGLQLAIVVIDFIPHMVAPKVGHKKSPCSGKHDHKHDHDHDHGHSHGKGGCSVDHSFKASMPFFVVGAIFIFLLGIDSIFLHSNSHSHDHNHSHDHSHDHSHNHTEQKENQGESKKKSKCSHNHGSSNTSIGTCNTGAISSAKSKKTAILYLLAISAHSFFEGLAAPSRIIIKNKNFGVGTTFLIGLTMHKILESFSLGLSIFSSSFSYAVNMMLVLFYSTLTPLGIIVGHLFTSNNKSMEHWFNALSLGSLMYVVFIEMISHSFHGGEKQKTKLLFLIIGYLAGFGLIIAS